MQTLIGITIITIGWLVRKLWLQNQRLRTAMAESPAQAIAQRFGNSLGLRRLFWRNRITVWGVQGLLALMILLVGMPSPQALACACSEVVVGSATETSNMTVDQTDGGLNLTQSDIEIPGTTPVRVVRTYSSNDQTYTLFGQGWTLDLVAYIKFYPGSTNTGVTGPRDSGDGSIDIYMGGALQVFSSGNGYQSKDGTKKLSFVGGDEVVVKDTAGNSWYFDISTGFLSSSFDAAGNETDYTWNRAFALSGGELTTTINTMYGIVEPVICPVTVTYPDGRQLQFTYDAAAETGATSMGNPQEATAPTPFLCTQITCTSSGFTVNYSYTKGLLTGVSKANGQVLSYGYYLGGGGSWNTGGALGGTDSSVTVIRGWLNKITYSNGAEVDITYNASNLPVYDQQPGPIRVLEVTGPNGYDHTYGYTDSSGISKGQVGYTDGGDVTTTLADSLGNNTSFAYSGGDTTEIDTDALGHVQTQYKNSYFQPTSVQDKNGNWWSYSYDSNRNTLSRGNPLGKTWNYGYNNNNCLTNSIDPLGRTNSFTYSSIRKMLSQKNGLGQLVVTNTYDGYGQLASSKDGANNLVQFSYDGHGNLTGSTDGAGKSWTSTYDSDGNKLSSTTPLGKTTSYGYDQFYKVASVTNPLGQSTYYTRDDMANLVAVQDANGNFTRSAYDQLQRLTSVTNAVGGVTKFDYNLESKMTTVTDPRNNAYGYGYDSAYRSTSFIFPNGSKEHYVRDQNGNVTSVTNAASQVISYGFDSANRLTTKTWQGSGTAFNYSYNDANELAKVIKVNGTTTNSVVAYTYNAASQIVTNSCEGRSISYLYDAGQRVSRVTYPSGAQERYAYNSRKLLDTLSDEAASVVAGYAYDDAGRMIKRTLANGLETVYGYDDADRVVSVILRQSSNTSNVVQSFAYGYDAVGNRLWVQYKNGTGDVYQYDATYQLTGVKYGVSNPTVGYGSATGASRTVTYSYDAAGNRTGTTDSAGGSTTYSSNNLNQYTAVAGSNYTYDSRGALTGDGTWTYSYDLEGNLTGASKSGVAASYTYDALGRRIQKTVNGTATNYVYDGQNLIEERSSSGTVVAKYLYQGGVDHPVKVIKGGNAYYFQQDSLGNVTALTDGTGSIIEQYSYDAYGAPTIKDGSGTILATSQTPFLFSGREYDSETGLYHYRARAYSPAMGRFLQMDPIKLKSQDLNLYRYVGNNPINKTDPMGTCDWKLALSIALTLLGIGAVVFAFVFGSIPGLAIGAISLLVDAAIGAGGVDIIMDAVGAGLGLAAETDVVGLKGLSDMVGLGWSSYQLGAGLAEANNPPGSDSSDNSSPTSGAHFAVHRPDPLDGVLNTIQSGNSDAPVSSLTPIQ